MNSGRRALRPRLAINASVFPEFLVGVLGLPENRSHGLITVLCEDLQRQERAVLACLSQEHPRYAYVVLDAGRGVE
jgi:hypothetical protein